MLGGSFMWEFWAVLTHVLGPGERLSWPVPLQRRLVDLALSRPEGAEWCRWRGGPVVWPMQLLPLIPSGDGGGEEISIN